MGFTAAEKEARHKALEGIMKEKDLRAIMLVGDMSVGNGFCGDFRYFTNNRVFFQRLAALAFPGFEPVMFTYSDFSRQAAIKRSFIADCRNSTNFIGDAISLLKQRGVTKGRLGVTFDTLPASWHAYLIKELPEVELVEVHQEIMRVRFRRSKEEAEMCRLGAALGDAAFQAALKVIRPGATEYEIVAAIEHATRAGGAEENFTLIGSGKFGFGGMNVPLPVPPSERRIEKGDSIALEITPRYQGYWTQLVRLVNVGEKNGELERMQAACRDAVKRGLEEFRPGRRVMDVCLPMQAHLASCGFEGKAPFGHICAVDLVDERVDLTNERPLDPGLALILHPMCHTKDGKNVIFWGETYLATAEGYERLHRTGDELITV